MKMIILGISALLMLGGCIGQPKPVVKPEPKPVVEKAKKKKSVHKAPRKHGKVPPLPEREVDMDMDNMVDQAMAGVLNDDNATQKMSY